MNRRILSVSLLALVAGPAVAADVRLDSYRHPQNERFREFNQLYLDGVRAGLMSYNARLKTHGGQLAFCMPDNLVLTADKSEEIMLRSAEKRSAKGDMLVSILLLSGLTDEFPCDKSAGR